MDIEYFNCECVYGKSGYILCKQCKIIEEADKNEFIKINVKRWKNRQQQREADKRQKSK